MGMTEELINFMLCQLLLPILGAGNQCNCSATYQANCFQRGEQFHFPVFTNML